MAPSINEFGVSFTVAHFDATQEYFEKILGFVFLLGWDGPEKGRGAYFHVGGNGIVEIYDGSAGGKRAPPPPRDAFALLITVDDIAATLRRVTSAGATADAALAEEPYGAFFSVREPSGIAICFMERRGESKRRFDALHMRATE